MPLFVLHGCAGKTTVYHTGLETETLSSEAKAVNNGIQAETNLQQEQDSGETSSQVYVHVCGAVQHPGVYSMEPGTRIYEAIGLAGGFTAQADEDWLNQADVLQDGQQLYVYTQDETLAMRQSSGRMDNDGKVRLSETDDRIDLNTATREELMTLPGIGEAKADAVIAYREEHGSFSSIEEIKNIPGIKNAVFSKIKDRITV